VRHNPSVNPLFCQSCTYTSAPGKTICEVCGSQLQQSDSPRRSSLPPSPSHGGHDSPRRLTLPHQAAAVETKQDVPAMPICCAAFGQQKNKMLIQRYHCQRCARIFCLHCGFYIAQKQKVYCRECNV
jgi:hypothetical protein